MGKAGLRLNYDLSSIEKVEELSYDALFEVMASDQGSYPFDCIERVMTELKYRKISDLKPMRKKSAVSASKATISQSFAKKLSRFYQFIPRSGSRY